MNRFGKVIKDFLISSIFMSVSTASYALSSMSDDSLSEVTGQALFSSSYVAPGSSGNPNTNIGFFRLGVEAKMEINANIDKLRLGCDGSFGAGLCDINIDHLRLTGISATDATDSGPLTDFVINQPFFEFAIKNPANPSTRQVVGIRFGSQSALGAMTIGENTNLTNLSDDTGINTISGDMTANIINATMTNVHTCIGFLIGTTCVGIPLSGSATVASASQQLTLKRQSQIADLGPMTAQASGSLLGLTLTNTHITNLPLDTIHRIEVRNPDGTATKDFYLSMQSQNITWQKISDGTFSGVAAQTGWWMSLPQVVMANITSNARVDVGAFAAIGGAIFGGRVDIPGIDLGQKPVDNCWGSSPFC